MSGTGGARASFIDDAQATLEEKAKVPDMIAHCGRGGVWPGLRASQREGDMR